MIDKEHSLPVTQQCRISNLSRSGIYFLLNVLAFFLYQIFELTGNC